MSLSWQTLDVTAPDAISTPCDCGGEATITLEGDVSGPDGWLARYRVQWSRAHPERDATFTLKMGDWTGAGPSDARWMMRADYRVSENAFMIRDLPDAIKEAVTATCLDRDDIIGTPFAADCFAMIDAIFMKHPMLEMWRK